jgi:ATP-binding cassette subfamily F protein uup
MNYLSVNAISKNLGERILFDDLSFGLSRGEKVALIANNGTGKSSLLKILAGKDQPDRGEVVFKQGIRLGYLEQDPKFNVHQTIEEMISESHLEVNKVISEYNRLLEEQDEHYSTSKEKELAEITSKMDELKAWDYERRMKQLLSKFGMNNTGQLVDELSGGQRKRLALAMLLLDEPDILLLDEPTNHLDIEMVEWLEKYLSQSNITLLMVTHDRYFLDSVCNNILEMEDMKLYQHSGNYEYFLEKKAEREEVESVELDKAKKLMKKELEWMRRSPKARTTKSKSRISAFHKTKEKAMSGKTKQELILDVKTTRIGGKILEMKKVSKSYGEISIMKGFDYTFKKGQKIGIVGSNGVGKSTFLNIITGDEEQDSGKINRGDTMVFGYYNQQGMQLAEDKRVIEVLREIADVIELSDGRKVTASQFLLHFMFPPKMQHDYVSKLSGGEKRRLYLLTVLIKNPNFLILDEPTNDLDLLTLTKLEEFLMNYKGCLLLVSHDRYFMDKLVDELFVFKGEGEIQSVNGSYSMYRDQQEQEKQEQQQQLEKGARDIKNIKPRESKKKASFKEKYEFEQLSVEIDDLEKEKTELENALATGELSVEELTLKSTRYSEVNEILDEKSLRWLELDELM